MIVHSYLTVLFSLSLMVWLATCSHAYHRDIFGCEQTLGPSSLVIHSVILLCHWILIFIRVWYKKFSNSSRYQWVILGGYIGLSGFRCSLNYFCLERYVSIKYVVFPKWHCLFIFFMHSIYFVRVKRKFGGGTMYECLTFFVALGQLSLP